MRKILIIISLVFSGAWLALGQEDAETTPEPELNTLFSYDTCNPPCWMGLIPGESTIADVETLLQENTELISPTYVRRGFAYLPSGERDISPVTGLMENGSYYFEIGETRPIPGGTSSRIDIRDGFIDAMVIHPIELIPARNILEILGTPEIFWLEVTTYGDTGIELIYLEKRVKIYAYQSTESCEVSFLTENMNLEVAVYLSPIAASESVHYLPELPSQPALTYRSFNQRDVPSDTWQSWLNGEVNESCEDAWNRLEVPEITPIPELTPEHDGE